MSGYAKRLEKNAVIVPHLIVRQCKMCTNPDANCNMYGNKIYCTPLVKGLKISGSDSLTQGLEELCIYNAYKENGAEKWWDYMLATYDCKDKSGSDYRDCIASAKDSVGIESSKLTQCLSMAPLTMEHEFELWLSSGIPYNPALVINNKVYRVLSTFMNNAINRVRLIHTVFSSRFAENSIPLLKSVSMIMILIKVRGLRRVE